MKKIIALLSAAVLCSTALAETHGILIGVNDYPDPTNAAGSPLKDEDGNPVSSKLRGAVNDANNMAKLFTTKYGVKKDNLIVLTDKQASMDGFLGALKSTFGKLSPNDQFVFSFSGHGTRFTSPDSKDPDGKSSAIVLQDMTLISGKVMGEVARALSAKGIKSTFIFDSCFAGGMSRDTNIYGIRGARKKTLDFSSLGKKAAVLGNKTILATVGSKSAPVQAAAPYAFIYASQYNVTSIDFPGNPEKGVEPQGLFTLALSAVLEDQPDAPIGDIVDAIAAFFEDTFKGNDIKQRPTDEFSSATRGKDPLIYKGV